MAAVGSEGSFSLSSAGVYSECETNDTKQILCTINGCAICNVSASAIINSVMQIDERRALFSPSLSACQLNVIKVKLTRQRQRQAGDKSARLARKTKQ